MPTPGYHSRLIDAQADLDAICANVAAQDELALDTEFARTNTYRPQLCLLQVATPGEMLCIDMLADLDTSALWRAIAAERALKVLHAARQDLEVFTLRFGAPPGPLFDTQIAAGFLGHPPQAGYATLVEAELGIRLDKSETRTDWTRRPLRASQVDYAAADVAYLAALRARLAERLQGLDRLAWAEEDSAALLDPDLYRVQPERAWERFPNLDHQPPAMQARARRLAAWRETRAASADRPRQWILSDQALMALANAGPVDVEGIERLDVLPAGAIRNSGAALLAELRRADEDLAAGNVSFTQKARQGPTDNGELKRLAAITQQLAGELGIAPELLATRGELTALLRGSRDLRALRGWRRQIIGDKLLVAL